MLVDLAVLHYYHAIRVQGWIGDLALHIERQFFGQDAFAAEGQERARRGLAVLRRSPERRSTMTVTRPSSAKIRWRFKYSSRA